MALPATRVETTFFIGRGFPLYTFTLFWELADGEISIANISQVADGVKAHFATAIRECLTETTSYAFVDVKQRTPSVSFDGRSTDAATVGIHAGDTLPEEDCVIIQRKTGLKGRSNYGRVFVPCVPELFQDDGRLNTLGIGKYKNLGSLMKQPMNLAATEVILQPMHANQKMGTLILVQDTRIVQDVMNRRDRRFPRRPYAVPTPA